MGLARFSSSIRSKQTILVVENEVWRTLTFLIPRMVKEVHGYLTTLIHSLNSQLVQQLRRFYTLGISIIFSLFLYVLQFHFSTLHRKFIHWLELSKCLHLENTSVLCSSSSLVALSCFNSWCKFPQHLIWWYFQYYWKNIICLM